MPSPGLMTAHRTWGNAFTGLCYQGIIKDTAEQPDGDV